MVCPSSTARHGFSWACGSLGTRRSQSQSQRFGQPLLGTVGERAVVSMFDGELQQNLVRRPFLVPAPEDVRLFTEEVGPNLQPSRYFRWCFAANMW